MPSPGAPGCRRACMLGLRGCRRQGRCPRRACLPLPGQRLDRDAPVRDELAPDSRTAEGTAPPGAFVHQQAGALPGSIASATAVTSSWLSRSASSRSNSHSPPSPRTMTARARTTSGMISPVKLLPTRLTTRSTGPTADLGLGAESGSGTYCSDTAARVLMSACSDGHCRRTTDRTETSRPWT